MVEDLHVHTQYSDGPRYQDVLRNAVMYNSCDRFDRSFDVIGFLDHCNPSQHRDYTGNPELLPDDVPRDAGFSETYAHRNEAIDAFVDRHHDVLDEAGITVLKGVEIDFHPDRIDRIRTFLDGAGFDFVTGSVHYTDDTADRYVKDASAYAAMSRQEQEAELLTYRERVIELAESGIADIVAHPGLPERNPAFDGMICPGFYDPVIDALLQKEATTETNAKSVERQGRPSDFMIAMHDEDVRFVRGSDAHRDWEIVHRAELLERRTRGLDEPVTGYPM